MLQTPMPRLAFECRRCGEPVPAGPLAVDAAARLILDRQCPGCGHRALYDPDDARPAEAIVAAS